jgi:hypothetical protein
MPEQPTYRIASVNIHKQNERIHMLLQCSPFDILLIQEPWWYDIGISHSDTDPASTTWQGTVCHPLWTDFLPHILTEDTTCKSVIYVCLLLVASALPHNCLDLPPASPSCIILDLTFPDRALCLVNLYHNVPDAGHGLASLLCWSVDDNIPTAVFGDFNTHTLAWLMPYTTTSPWAATLEDWVDASGLHLLLPPQVPTWHSPDGTCLSVLDLFLMNNLVLVGEPFSLPSVSFEDLLGSDHALVSTIWSPPWSLSPLPHLCVPTFTINDNLQQTWSIAFA